MSFHILLLSENITEIEYNLGIILSTRSEFTLSMLGVMIMKRIATVGICLLFVGVSIAAAASELSQQAIQTMPLNPTGTFEGNIGYKRQGQNATIVGTINGTYEMRNRGGRFTGDWATENRTGTFRGVFGRHILIGKISLMVNGTEKSLPIVGFIRAQNGSFIGRFMAPVGPALYFWGEYT
jgi:hypothetical protein